MKTPSLLLATTLALAPLAPAQQARRLQAGETSALEAAPVKEPPKFFSKGASTGPVTEESREYISKGAAGVTAKSAVVRINYTDGTVKEEPYVEVPLLFRVGTAELLDKNSRANVLDVIAQVRKIVGADSHACFRVEGHASAEGDGALNERLAHQRAAAIQQTLAAQCNVGSANLHSEGRGARDAKAPATAPESQLQQDRKVLVVREQ